ncbi:hypothetical protein SteCoe_23776 [Stentor coeruleus]|uniref:Iron-binding zinc finger CDGSH type domain-containing protein n=1 Tax=Stentor coeruleus TaxID=5963 RepID=A0A1R2BJ64_9CILI|nr:hypothetical protein SteCoe_23776 [Stentor coeruleus]
MLRRLFAELKVIEERKSFKIFKIPRKTHKQEFIKLEEFQTKPEPICVANRPFIFNNPKAGDKKYFWCTCGLSRKQPFCDSSHMQTAFKPLSFIIQEDVKQVALCLCKKSTTAPYCDFKTCGCAQESKK